MRRFDRVFVAVMLAAGVAMAVPAAQAAGEAPVTAREPSLPSIYVVEAKKQEIVETVSGSGYVRAAEEVFVQPQIEGLAIETADIEVGDRVEEGEVVATLSKSSLELEKTRLAASRAKAVASVAQLEAQVAEAKANSDEAVRVRDRYKTLSANGTMARSQYEQADAAASVALARVSSAERVLDAGKADIAVVDAQLADVALKLSRTEVKAPVAGVVSEKTAKIGAIAGMAGQPLYTIMRDGALELRAEIAEGDILNVKSGQEVGVWLAGWPKPAMASVRLVEPTVDLTTRLGIARIAFPEESGVRAGMFAEAAIVVDRKEAVVVPIPTVSISGTESSVLKVANGEVRRTPVVTGIRSEGMVEIVEGISAGDLLVAKAGAFVRDGDRINPILRESVSSTSTHAARN